MSKIQHWRESKKNINLDIFCKKGEKCPECGAELECQEDKYRMIQVCPSCDYTTLKEENTK